MYRKIVLCLFLSLLLVSSCFAETSDHYDLSIYLGETLNLSNYFQTHGIDMPLHDNVTVQNTTERIATLDENFMLTPQSVGDDLIILENGGDFITLYCHVISPITYIESDVSELTLLLGEVYTLDYEIITDPDFTGTVNHTLRWSSSRPNVARVTGSNQILTQAAGTTTLTGTSIDGTANIAIALTVTGHTEGLTIDSSKPQPTMNAGETYQLQAYLGTKNVTDTIYWKSMAPDIVSVDAKGLVTARKEGKCEIVAQSTVSHKKDTYTIFVKSLVDSITVNRSKLSLEHIGDTAQLTATVNLKDLDTPVILTGYTYTTSNSSIATVTQNGLVTAVGSGTALITVSTHDSQKKDYCTVDVISNHKATSIDYKAVDTVTLSATTAPVLIGEKVPLNYTIEPKDATDQTLEFDIPDGRIDQIKYIDGHYYFVADKRGTVDIEVTADNDAEDKISLSVVSPIDKLELNLSTDRGTTTKKEMYIGETLTVITDITPRGHYSDYDVYPKTLSYSVDDPDILKLETLNGEQTITALKEGTTTIYVEDLEGRNDDHLTIEVNIPTKNILSDQEVILPTGIPYRPQLYFEVTKGLKTVSDFNLYNGIALSVEAFYFDEAFINEEISYEESMIQQLTSFEEQVSDESSISFHQKRLKTLKTMQSNLYRGYTRTDASTLTNRYGEPYTLYNIDGRLITGFFSGKAIVNMTLAGTARSTSLPIYFSNNHSQFSIKTNNHTASLNELMEMNKLTDVLKDAATEEKIELYIYYISHREWFKETPNMTLLKALSTLETDKLPETIFSNLKATTTKEELAFVSMYLHERYVNSKDAVALDNIIYYDVTSKTVKEALARDYVLSNSDNYFGSTASATYFNLEYMLRKLNLTSRLDFTPSTDKVTHEELILLLSQISK
ncbi:MAG: Ig domain-containing protein [Clostridia bacterium]|nr:Ig domain-containing protein [Clostridia bacterium]